MPPRSSITANPAVQEAVDQLLAQGFTVDEVTDAVAEYNISRSAVGRYAKGYRPIVEGIIRDRAIQKALKRHLPDGNSELVDMALHRAQVQVLRTLDAMGDDDEAGSPKNVNSVVRALNALIDAMRRKRVHDDEVRESERKRSAEAAGEAAREAGVSEAQIDVIRRRILGLKS